MASQQHARRLGSTGGIAAVGLVLTLSSAFALAQLSSARWWTHLSWALPVVLLVVGTSQTSSRRLRRLETTAQQARVDMEWRVEQLRQDLTETVGGLRDLVAQVRGGGDQIAMSAEQLLATAEEHAASASQQSSAVSETTATIEELAATAKQIAETAEAVAHYAAQTLRYAEDGRSAVTASVESMDTIAFRVEAISARAV
ncbi:MAG TPA: methyl-accepting chemotaxis protein, partial [Nonomuraea sp.]|nr:methyl-accepting chemotaxis protein [Nonomuraea sp.]